MKCDRNDEVVDVIVLGFSRIKRHTWESQKFLPLFSQVISKK